MHKNKGFTLIELMVVVVIIGVLATIAMVKYGNIMRIQHMQQCRRNLMAIHSASNIYQVQNGRWPVNDLNIIPISPAGLGAINAFFTAAGIPLNLQDDHYSYGWSGDGHSGLIQANYSNGTYGLWHYLRTRPDQEITECIFATTETVCNPLCFNAGNSFCPQ